MSMSPTPSRRGNETHDQSQLADTSAESARPRALGASFSGTCVISIVHTGDKLNVGHASAPSTLRLGMRVRLVQRKGERARMHGQMRYGVSGAALRAQQREPEYEVRTTSLQTSRTRKARKMMASRHVGVPGSIDEIGRGVI